MTSSIYVIYILINIGYIILAFWILDKIGTNFTGKSSSTYCLLALSIASVFFVAGLLLFNIPLAILGATDPDVVNRMKEKWYAFPAVFFVLFLISWALEKRKKGYT